MTPEAQRIAIAEACGWTKIEWYEDNQGPPILHGFPPPRVGLSAKGEWEAKTESHSKTVPTYLDDLNDMYDAEAELMAKSPVRYGHYCDLICDSLVSGGDPDVEGIIHISASHRAEFFLRALNLWDDSK